MGPVKILRVIFLIFLGLLLGGCNDATERRAARLKTMMSFDNAFRSSDQSKSVWIAKHSWAGKIYIGAIFGYIDNPGSCKELVEPYNKKYPEVYYSCEEI